MEDQKFIFGKYSIGLFEIRDLVISAVLLAVIFSFSNWSFTNFLISLAVLAPSLLLHELAHKFMAQRYDLIAAYAIWPVGILMSVMITILTGGTTIVAMLGAVMIESSYRTRLGFHFVGVTRSEMGKIAVSGPLTNYALAIVSLILYNFSNYNVFYLSAKINTIIGLFNSLPFPPLDGSKILGWNIPLFIWTFATGLMLLFLPSLIGLLFTGLVAFLSLLIFLVVVQLFFPVQQQSSSEYF